MSDTYDNEQEDDLAPTTPPGATISYSASLVRQGKHRFYTLTMPSEVLAQTCTVDTRIEDPIKGFQRRLDTRRAKDIANYIDRGFGTIPGSIILSAQPEAELTYTRAKRTIGFKKHPRAFLILDGQHRVYGFHFAESKKLRVPVVIYNGLSKADEARLFRDINTNQKPVPNELLLDINRLAETETNEEAMLHDVFNLFDKDTGSPLFGLMSPSEKHEGKISRVTFNAAVRAIADTFGDSDPQKIYEVLSGYLQAWLGGLRARGFPESITNPTMFRAVMLIFPFVAGRVYDRYQGKYTVENFNEVLAPLLDKLKKSDIHRQGATHVDLNNLFRKRLEAGFSIAGSTSLF